MINEQHLTKCLRLTLHVLLSYQTLLWARADKSFPLCSRYLYKRNPARMAQEPRWDKLCLKCQAFRLDPRLWPRDTCNRIPFHDINALLKSAKEGCHFCNLLVAELPESTIQSLQSELELEPQHCFLQLQVMAYSGCAIGPDPFLHSGFHLWHQKLRPNNDASLVHLVPMLIFDLRGK